MRCTYYCDTGNKGSIVRILVVLAPWVVHTGSIGNIGSMGLVLVVLVIWVVLVV